MPVTKEDLQERIAAHADAFAKFPLWWTIYLRNVRASLIARDVLSILASYADKNTGEAYPSIGVMAATLGITTKTVKAALRELKGIGLLKSTTRNRRLGETNLYHLAIHGQPFQVTDGVPLITGLGNHIGTDQVTISWPKHPDQVTRPSTNRAKNLPIKPTNEPTTVGRFSEKTENDEKLVSLMERCGLNGRAESEALRFSQLFPSQPEIDCFMEWVFVGLKADSVRDPLALAIKKTQRGESPPTPDPKKSLYPIVTTLPDGCLAFDGIPERHHAQCPVTATH